MKTLFAGIALIILIGVGGFLYRNVLENQDPGVSGACTLEAKICPDGTTVGRSGPSCEFAPCLFPNVTLPALTISFAVPKDYVENKDAPGDNSTLIMAYEKTGTSTPPDAIVVYRFPIPEGQTASDVILANTRLEPSDMAPKDMKAFSPKIIGTRTFSAITIERFEAVIHTAYYLPRAHDVLRFDVLDHNVNDWMKPNLIVDNLPENQALIKMLGTLVDSTPAGQ
ncbi:MAG: hypothetical protein WAV21_02450 [Minisyncoccia bacterium]